MRKSNFYSFFLLVFIVFSGCKKDTVEDATQTKPLVEKQGGSQNTITSENGNEGLMEFAEATANPYTVENMQLAYQELIQGGEIACNNLFNIRVTHRYIKFKPQNAEQRNLLLDNTSLILFDYPLHRKLSKAGTYYKDPSLSDDELNFQWTCVKINTELPQSVPYDILNELYLPEEDPELEQYDGTPQDDCITLLVEKALKRTGNFDTTYRYNITSGGELLNKWKLPSKWTPAGRITMSDDVLGQIPLKGCKVKVHRWFEIREQLTDNNGHFNVGHRFRYPVNYSIKWERNDFEIRHKRTGQAHFNGPDQRGDWNLNISSGYSRMYAIIHRAAHRYYYEGDAARANLRTPPLRTTMLGRITIGAFDWENVDPNGDCAMIKRWVGFPEIRIFKPSRTSDRIFTTVCHELGHASHWNLGKNDYTFADNKVAESWAVGTGNALFQLEYPNTIGRLKNMPDYTLIVIDMVDNPIIENTLPSNNGFTLAQGDLVNNYTYREIENSLIGQRTWNGWRNKIKNDHNNATENNLDALFNLWN